MNNRFSRLIDRIHFLGLLAAIVLIPLVFNVDNQNIVLLKPIIAEFLALFLIALWFVDALERGEFRLNPTPLNAVLVIYLLWLIVTIVLNPDFLYFSLEELNRYVSVFIFYFLAQKTIRSHTRLKWCLWILFGVCLIATGYGLLQYNDFKLIQWGREVLVATFGNKNFFAGFLVLTMPVVFGYAIATPKPFIKIILALLGLAQLLAILLTETRTGFLAVIAGAAVFLFLAARFVWWKKSENKLIHSMIALWILLFVGVIVYLMASENFIDRLGQAVDLQAGTGRVRWIMWTGSTRAAIDQPLTGHSHGAFQLVFPFYRPTMYHRFRVSHNTRHSHNEFLEVLMETGTVGLALFLLIFVVLGLVVFRFLARNQSWFYQWLVIGLISGVSASLAQNFASVNFRWMSSTFLFWLLVSLIIAAIRVATNAESHLDQIYERDNSRSLTQNNRLLPPLSWKTWVHALVGIVVMGGGYGFYRLLKADFKLKETNAMIRYAESRRMNWSRAAEVGKRAVGLNPYNLSARYKLGFIYLKMPNQRKALKAYDNLTDLAPNYAQIHNNIALIHKKFNRPYRSLLHFEWATILEDNFRNHLNLMRRHSRQNLTKRALEHTLSSVRIFHEEQRNYAHRVAKGAYDQEFSNIEGRTQKRIKHRNKLLSALTYMAGKFGSIKPEFAQFSRMKQFLTDPGSRSTVQQIMKQSREGESMLEPINWLALSLQLRDDRDKNTNAIRQQYLRILTQWLKKNPDKDPMYRLVVGELYRQIGQKELARRSIQGYESEWENDPFLESVVNRISGEKN